MPEVIDVWFDSGSMPFAQHHAPFENEERFEAALPGRLRLRGARPDARLVLLADRGLDAAQRPRAVPQRRLPRACWSTPNGQKMSKSRGNVSRPGTSSTASAPTPSAGTSSPPSSPGTATASRSTRSARSCASSCASCGTTYSFFVLYANAGDGARRAEPHGPRPLGALAPGGDGRDGARAPRRLRRDERRARDRRVRRGPLELVRAPLAPALLGRRPRRASTTLRTALVTVAQLLAPFTPFVADEIYDNLDGGLASVHLCDFPESRASATSSSSSRWRRRARPCGSASPPARQGDVKVRQPLREAVIVADGREREAIERAGRGRARGAQRDRAALRRRRRRAGDLHRQAELPHARPALRQAHADARRRGRGARPGRRSRARCATDGPSSCRSTAPTTSSAPTTSRSRSRRSRATSSSARARTPSRSSSRSTTS